MGGFDIARRVRVTGGLSVAAAITDAESNFMNMKLLRAVGRYIAAFVFPLARLNRCLSSDMR